MHISFVGDNKKSPSANSIDCIVTALLKTCNALWFWFWGTSDDKFQTVMRKLIILLKIGLLSIYRLLWNFIESVTEGQWQSLVFKGQYVLSFLIEWLLPYIADSKCRQSSIMNKVCCKDNRMFSLLIKWANKIDSFFS